MPVTSQHKEYAANSPKWQLVRDSDEGSLSIKLRSKGGNANSLTGMAGTAYLPAPNASDTSSENKERYLAYLERANFVNFTGYTKEGMLGLVFRKKTLLEAKTDVEYLIDDANGDGLSTDQMIKDVTGDVLMLGRYGLLTEYPTAPEGVELTVANVDALGLRANILSYPAESVINWRSVTVGGVSKLSLVVLVEPTEKSDDDFEYESVTYHRVLLLKEVDGKLTYVQNIYDDEDNLVLFESDEVDEDGDKVLTGDIIPKKFDGSTWDEIPFTFVGSVNNDVKVDKAPLYDIAAINIAHYRNSADYEESSFLVGQPTPWFSGLTQGWVDENMEGGVAFGSRAAVLLPEAGAAGLLQANENQMPLKGMEIKERQMVMIGARLIADQGGNETVDAVKIRFSGQNSKLGSILGNVEEAFKKCYGWAGEFMGAAVDETLVKINREFYDASVDPQMLVAKIQLMDRGVIGKTDVREYMRKGNLIDAERTDDDIENEAEDIGSLDNFGGE